MTQNNIFFTIPQAAKFCSISRVTLWRWVKSGKLKAFLTPGGQYKIRKDDLVSFIRGEMGHLPGNEFSQETKILIVDDDPQVQKLFKKMLSRNGYSIEVASDGFEAGVKTVQFKPDLIILDLIMPGMDGFEVCRQIKQNANTSHIKIIACTGYDTKENKDRIMQAGADGYLVKPVEKSALFQKIKGLLSDTV
uniref:Response regulator n=1 Tax=Candidatus Desulfatibia profunda TaxID=2841695 RepID=A0A8J6NW78_9BACT|nr:response regulator [Candidatus Desulfatibia profunda]